MKFQSLTHRAIYIALNSLLTPAFLLLSHLCSPIPLFTLTSTWQHLTQCVWHSSLCFSFCKGSNASQALLGVLITKAPTLFIKPGFILQTQETATETLLPHPSSSGTLPFCWLLLWETHVLLLSQPEQGSSEKSISPLAILRKKGELPSAKI